MAQPFKVGPYEVGNRWCIQPMEGWDGGIDGAPTEILQRRWKRFGASGAKLIWGCEAVAVRPDGRANVCQLTAELPHEAAFAGLLQTLREEHKSRYGKVDDLLVGLQLTHSGRYARPQGKPEPLLAWHHPLLDARMGIDASDHSRVISDDGLRRLIEDYVRAAHLAERAGFGFVDVKCCHGYLLHELLGARERPGPFGGDLAGRTLFLRTVIQRLRSEVPHLLIGVRLSAADVIPFHTWKGEGAPEAFAQLLPYRWGFGVDAHEPTRFDLTETREVLRMLEAWGVSLVNISAGSPYYNPHILRPAAFPPSDGYPPPVDPLCGVVDHVELTKACKEAAPNLPLVGSGYSYLQDYLPHVAQGVLRNGWTDFVGIGRMGLSYPEMPVDVLSEGRLKRKQICRTFSDCTTAPRNGMISGCYPLDPFYKEAPEAERMAKLKRDGQSKHAADEDAL